MKKWIELGKIKGGTREAIIEIILKNRGILTKKERDEFLHPAHPKDLSLSRFRVNRKQMEKAVLRVKLAIKNREKIVVYGDYDADGVSAAAIVWETLFRRFRANIINPYIPDRFSEGYGLKIASLTKLKEENPDLKLVITVDHGIVAHEAVKKASQMGLEVIIIDHHLPATKRPGALAIVLSTKICASACAWVFVRELTKGDPGFFEKTLKMLDLVAIGTVSDVMPLVGVNRSFVWWGLDLLEKTQRPGLIELMKLSQIGAKFGKRKIGVWEVGFTIAPRLNSVGRLESALDALRLLCVLDQKRAAQVARALERTNRERQRVLEEAVSLAKEEMKEDERIIFLASENYHEGVIGLVASRLVEIFYKPAIVVSLGEKDSKASGRSIEGFNIVESVLGELSDLGVDGGGHAAAFGFSFKTEDLEAVKERIQKVASRGLNENLLTRKLKIDCVLEFAQLDQELADLIALLAPFGPGNPEPVFSTKDTLVKKARTVGQTNKHLKLTVEKEGRLFEAICFGMGEMLLKVGDRVDLAYNLVVNIWNGNKKPELNVKDIKIRKE